MGYCHCRVAGGPTGVTQSSCEEGVCECCDVVDDAAELVGDLVGESSTGQVDGPRGLAEVGQWRQQFRQRRKLDLAVLGGCRDGGRERRGMECMVAVRVQTSAKSRSRVVVAARSTTVTSFSARTVSIG